MMSNAKPSSKITPAPAPVLGLHKPVVSSGKEYRPTPRVVKVTPKIWAVVESGVTVEMLFIEGLDPEVMKTIDTGSRRSFGDVLSIDGGKNVTLTAAVVRLLAWWSVRDSMAFGSIQPTHSELVEILSRPENRDIPERITEVAATKKARKIVTPSALAFTYLMAYRNDPGKAGAWLSMIDTGAGADDLKHPVLQLRERMLANREAKSKVQTMEVLALTIKSWNQFKTGKRTTNLRWKSTETFPEFVDTLRPVREWVDKEIAKSNASDHER